MSYAPLPLLCWPEAVNDPHQSCVLEDIPNFMGVLVGEVLQRPCDHDHRPDIPTRRKIADQLLEPKSPYFAVANARTYHAEKHGGFERLMRKNGCPVLLVEDGACGDPVDRFIIAQIDLLIDARVVLIAHDHGYAPCLRNLLRRGGAVDVIGFAEHIAPQLHALRSFGARLWDAEHDFGLFHTRLPNRPSHQQIRVILGQY